MTPFAPHNFTRLVVRLIAVQLVFWKVESQGVVLSIYVFHPADMI
jgi:hypothetical protein